MRNVLRIDLHRVRHEDVRNKVIRFIEKNWASKLEAEIVTGNSSIMQKLVMEVLDEYKLSYQISRMFDPYNQGYIVTWLE